MHKPHTDIHKYVTIIIKEIETIGLRVREHERGYVVEREGKVM